MNNTKATYSAAVDEPCPAKDRSIGNERAETSDSSRDEQDVNRLIPFDVVRYVEKQTGGPDWRWQMAMRVASGRMAGRHFEFDKTIELAIQWIGNKQQAAMRRQTNDPTINFQRLLDMRASVNSRLNIEAKVLARIPSCVIANEAGISINELHDYCGLFFDVTDCLNATEWIASRVIYPENINHDPIRSAILHAAYHGGEAICRYWLTFLPEFGTERDLTTEAGRQREQLELAIQQQQLIRENDTKFLTICLSEPDEFCLQSSQFRTVSQIVSQQSQQEIKTFFGNLEATAGSIGIEKKHRTRRSREIA